MFCFLLTEESLPTGLNQPPVAYLRSKGTRGRAPQSTPFSCHGSLPQLWASQNERTHLSDRTSLPTWIEDLTFGSALSPLVEGARDDGVRDLSPIAPCGTIKWTWTIRVSMPSHGLAKQKRGHGPQPPSPACHPN